MLALILVGVERSSYVYKRIDINWKNTARSVSEKKKKKAVTRRKIFNANLSIEHEWYES